jgi:hypothetical protein
MVYDVLRENTLNISALNKCRRTAGMSQNGALLKTVA